MFVHNLNFLCVEYQMSYEFIKNTENVINILLKEKENSFLNWERFALFGKYLN